MWTLLAIDAHAPVTSCVFSIYDEIAFLFDNCYYNNDDNALILDGELARSTIDPYRLELESIVDGRRDAVSERGRLGHRAVDVRRPLGAVLQCVYGGCVRALSVVHVAACDRHGL